MLIALKNASFDDFIFISSPYHAEWRDFSCDVLKEKIEIE
jgi:hypothetical protein